MSANNITRGAIKVCKNILINAKQGTKGGWPTYLIRRAVAGITKTTVTTAIIPNDKSLSDSQQAGGGGTPKW